MPLLKEQEYKLPSVPGLQHESWGVIRSSVGQLVSQSIRQSFSYINYLSAFFILFKSSTSPIFLISEPNQSLLCIFSFRFNKSLVSLFKVLLLVRFQNLVSVCTWSRPTLELPRHYYHVFIYPISTPFLKQVFEPWISAFVLCSNSEPREWQWGSPFCRP